MKKPAYFLTESAEIQNAGLSVLGALGLADSFAGKPTRFRDEAIVLRNHAHNAQDVWILLSKFPITPKDFEDGRTLPRPMYFLDEKQEQINAGLNAFGAELLAESFADDPERFGDDIVVIQTHAQSTRSVWIVLSKEPFTAEDFAK